MIHPVSSEYRHIALMLAQALERLQERVNKEDDEVEEVE